VSWTGLINENIFKRPAAVLTVIFDGVDDVTLANPVASFPLVCVHASVCVCVCVCVCVWVGGC
jgi:hypothetical protein